MPQLRAIGLSQLVAPHAGPGVTSNVHIRSCTVQRKVPSSVITTILENDALFLSGHTMSSLSPLSLEDHVSVIGLLSTVLRRHPYLLFHLFPHIALLENRAIHVKKQKNKN
jgi:hypothetical protein